MRPRCTIALTLVLAGCSDRTVLLGTRPGAAPQVTRLASDDPAGRPGVDYPERRTFHAAAADGVTFHVFGGRNSETGRYLASLWTYNVETRTWSRRFEVDSRLTAGVDHPIGRVGHAMVMAGRRLILFGGYDGARHLNDVWSFDLQTNGWQLLKQLDPGGMVDVDFPAGRGFMAPRLPLLGDAVYVFGGYGCGYGRSCGFYGDVWRFDLTSTSWSRLTENRPAGPDVPGGRTNFDLTDVPDGFLIVGGHSGSSEIAVDDLWSFAPQSRSWRKLAAAIPFLPARELHRIALLGDRVFLFGGRDDGRRFHNDLWALTLADRAWMGVFPDDPPGLAIGADYPSRRWEASIVAVQRSLFLFGGEDAQGRSHNDIWRIDPQ